MTRLAIGLVTVFAVSLSAAGGQAGAEQRRELRVAYITPVVTAPSPRDLWGQGLLGFHRAVKDFEIRGQVFQPDPNNWVRRSLPSSAEVRSDLPGGPDHRPRLRLAASTHGHVLGDEVRRRRPVQVLAVEAAERPRHGVQGSGRRVPRGLPRSADGEAKARQGRDRRGRRGQGQSPSINSSPGTRQARGKPIRAFRS